MERRTRYVLHVHLPEERDATTVRNALSCTMTGFPEHLRKSLTWDQGTERAEHKQFQTDTGIPVSASP